MSTEVVTKKRGRPKKHAVEDIIVIEDSAPTKPKKARPSPKTTFTPRKADSEKPTTLHSPILIARDGGNDRPELTTSPIQNSKKEVIDEPSGRATATKAEGVIQPDSSPILKRAKAFEPAPGKLPIIRSTEGKPQKPSFSPQISQNSQTNIHLSPNAMPTAHQDAGVAAIKPPTDSPKSKFLTDFLTTPSQAVAPILKKPERPPRTSAPPMAFSLSQPTIREAPPPPPPPPSTTKPPSPAPTTPAQPARRAVMPSSVPPPRGPPPPKPTELPYDVIRRDPRFKSLSRKYTSLMVAIPILIVTSYTLYARYTGQTERKRASEPVNGGV